LKKKNTVFFKKKNFFLQLWHQVFTSRSISMTDMVWECFVVLIVLNKSVYGLLHSILDCLEAIWP
jgi:hypothetical protein